MQKKKRSYTLTPKIPSRCANGDSMTDEGSQYASTFPSENIKNYHTIALILLVPIVQHCRFFFDPGLFPAP